MNADLGKEIQVVGDDLLVTNPKRIQKAIEGKSKLRLISFGSFVDILKHATLCC